MGGGGPVLVIGAPSLSTHLAAALPAAHVVLTSGPLEAIWVAGRDGCSAICVEVAPSQRTDTLIPALRVACATARIVVACHPVYEPLARAAIDDGADDYLLLPLDAAEVRAAFRLPDASVTANASLVPSDAAPLVERARVIPAVEAKTLDVARWREAAQRDALTGLHNRRQFDQMLEHLLAGASNRRENLTVLLFDIDDLKTYNHRFGHAAGDALLREVAALLRYCTRATDVLARIGGDEFAVIFWDAEKPRHARSEHPRNPMALAPRFQHAIVSHAFRSLGPDRNGPVTISGGLAAFPRNASSPDGLVVSADQALLAAKQTGKNRIHLAGAGVAGQ